MYQVNFSDQSMGELKKIDVRLQMELVEIISSISKEKLKSPSDNLRRFIRNGKVFYRLRAKDFRIYFEINSNQLYAKCVLHKNTLTDFIFRTKLPVKEEFLAEQEDSFWSWIDSLVGEKK